MAGYHDYSYYQRQMDNLVDVPDYFSNPSINPDAHYNPFNDANYQKAFQSAITPSVLIPSKRTLLDRGLDLLSTPLYATAGFVDGLVKGENPFVDAGKGLAAGNPFGDGNPDGRYTYSRVLEDAGWQPTSMFGKVAKGALGFGLDVLLDPTTYLSGGTSALLKGAGLAGKAEDALTALSHAYGDGSKLTEMTPDIAQNIVKQRAAQSGVDMSQDQITADAENLKNKYNNLIGLRQNQPDLTWSLGNSPFGKKIWGWTGLADKKFTVANADKLRQVSDDSGLSQMYSELRDSIYGSKIGELFSNKSPLYNLAHQDPSRLYDVLKFQDYVHGMNLDKLQAEKQVRDYAANLGLDPAESKEVLNALQDKTLWGKVQSTVRFMDTSKAQALRQNMQMMRDAIQSQLAEVASSKDALDNLRFAHENGLTHEDASQAIRDLEDELHGKLTEMDVNHVLQHGDLEKQLQTLDAESKKVNPEAPVENSGVTPEQILESHQAWQDQKKASDQYHQLQSTLSTLSPDSEEYLKTSDQLAKLEGAPHQGARFDTIDRLNQYLGTNIVHTAHEADLEPLIKMIQDGTDTGTMTRYVEDRPNLLSSRNRDMWSHIASQIGYGSGTKHPLWENFFDDRVRPIMEAVAKGDVVTPADKQLLHTLFQKQLERGVLKRKLSSMSDEDFYKYLTDHANEQMMNDFGDVEHLANTTGKSAPRSEEQRRAEALRSDEPWRGDNLKDFNDKLDGIYGKVDDQTEYQNMIDAIASHIPSDEANNPFAHRWLADVYGELKNIVDNGVQQKFSTMTKAQQNFMVDNAIKSASARMTGGQVKDMGAQDHLDTLRQAAAKEANRRMQMSRMDALQKEIGVGSEIHHIQNGRVQRSVVDSLQHDESGQLLYNVKNVKDGSESQVKLPDVASVLKENQRKTADQLILQTPVARQQVSNLNEIQRTMDTIRGKISDLESGYRDARQNLINGYEQRIEEAKSNMVKAEMTNTSFHDVLQSDEVDSTRASALSSRLQKMDEILGNDDAFESYIRLKYGDKFIHDAVKDATDVGQIVLDTKTDLSDKEKEIAKQLRGKLQTIGYEEYHIGKLGKEQLDAHLDDYVAHILTPDGGKFFKNQDKVEKAGVHVTNDLGYGTKFNPFKMSRSIKKVQLPDGTWVENPTIDQINEAFKPLASGRNVFSDNLSDIYVARAMKHVELMYDDQYMNTMMTHFGKELPGDTPDEGYKAVVNFGKLKNTLHDMAKSHLSMEISGAASDFIKQNIEQFKEEAHQTGESLSDLLSNKVGEFIQQTYPDAVRKEKYQGYLQQGAEMSGLHPNILDTFAVPMVELNPDQIKGLREYFDNTLQSHHALLDYNEENAKAFGNTDRLEKIQATRDKLHAMEPPQIVQVTKEIVDKANQARKVQIAKDTNRFLQMYDKFTHFIKLGQTTIMPAFHMRNKMSNAFLNWLGVGNDALNPKTQVTVWKLVRNGGKDDDIKNNLWPVKQADGTYKQMHWSDIYDLAKQYGAIDDGYFARDMRVGSVTEGSAGVLPGAIPAKFDPTDTKNFFGYKWGAKFGNHIENTDRLIHFASMLKQGASPREAAESVNKFLFDYGDLTAFEQNVMKRIIPFYTWMRKNGRLQVSQMLEQPGKYRDVAKAQDEVNGMNNQDERVNPDLMAPFTQGFLQLPFSVMSKSHSTEPVLLNAQSINPASSINDLPDPFHPMASLTNLFNNMNPILKTPIEQGLNYNYFLDRPIVSPTSTNPLADRLLEVLKQNSAFSAGNSLNTTDGNKIAFNLIGDLTGLKMMPYDYNTYKNQYIQQLMQNQNIPYKPTAPKRKSPAKNNLGLPTGGK